MDHTIKNLLISGIIILGIIIFGIVAKTFEAHGIQKEARNTGVIIDLANANVQEYLNNKQYRIVTSCGMFITDVPELSEHNITLEKFHSCMHPKVELRCYGDWVDAGIPENHVSRLKLQNTDPRASRLYAKIFNMQMMAEIKNDNDLTKCFKVDNYNSDG
ncbi:MAG: hypothetical protein HKN88_08425 [Gammaproteobacteria bacterium]|nr:hypothetical protein [Gammaproteobacteria bacterium]NNC98086.1 hypothetical protein [Gammaproteobacteria bacterium]NNM13150.1 hypothetical protein [Gammaproteobacteria bacterium]